VVPTEQRRDSFRARGNPESDLKKILFLILLVRAGNPKEKRAKTIIKVVVVNVEFLSQIPWDTSTKKTTGDAKIK
jgi:hypothetical protein